MLVLFCTTQWNFTELKNSTAHLIIPWLRSNFLHKCKNFDDVWFAFFPLLFHLTTLSTPSAEQRKKSNDFTSQKFFWFFKCAINSSCVYEHDRFSICNKSCKNKKHKPVYELGVCVKITVGIVCDPQNWHRCSYFHTSHLEVPFFLSFQKREEEKNGKNRSLFDLCVYDFFCFILFVSRVFSDNMYGLR